MKISGIGPTKEATLASYGIESAADVDSGKVLGVPGFGPANSRAAARISNYKLSKQWLDHKLMLARTTRNHAAVPNYFKMWTEGDFSEEVRKARPQVPLLVVAGEWDQEAFLEPRMRDTFMAWHPKSELIVIRNCGHCPMQETPIYLATLIENFMKRYAD